jgi:hypothetical protein
MKIKIVRVNYYNLRLYEFVIVYEQTLGVCEKYDMNALRLEKSYGELVSYRPTIESLKVHLRKNEKLAFVGKLDDERDGLTNVAIHVVKAFSAGDIPEINFHSKQLEALLAKHNAKTIAADSRAAETERLKLLETDINTNVDIQNAISALGLTPVVSRLFDANREYDALFMEYISEKGAEQHIDSLLLRQNCSKALTQFFDAVQYSAYVYEDLDYTPLINELVKLNQYYSQQLKARATRRKNGSKTEEEQPIQPMDNGDLKI